MELWIRFLKILNYIRHSNKYPKVRDLIIITGQSRRVKVVQILKINYLSTRWLSPVIIYEDDGILVEEPIDSYVLEATLPARNRYREKGIRCLTLKEGDVLPGDELKWDDELGWKTVLKVILYRDTLHISDIYIGEYSYISPMFFRWGELAVKRNGKIKIFGNEILDLIEQETRQLISRQLISGNPVTVNMQISLVSNWCKANGWSNPQFTDLQFYSIPPNSYLPIPLPYEALIEVGQYQEVFDTLWTIRETERISDLQKDKAIVFNIMCVLLLCVKDIFKKSTLVKVPDIIYPVINTSMALFMLVAVAYAWAAISNYWGCCQQKNKLNSSSMFKDMLTKLENV